MTWIDSSAGNPHIFFHFLRIFKYLRGVRSTVYSWERMTVDSLSSSKASSERDITSAPKAVNSAVRLIVNISKATNEKCDHCKNIKGACGCVISCCLWKWNEKQTSGSRKLLLSIKKRNRFGSSLKCKGICKEKKKKFKMWLFAICKKTECNIRCLSFWRVFWVVVSFGYLMNHIKDQDTPLSWSFPSHFLLYLDKDTHPFSAFFSNVQQYRCTHISKW